MIKIRSNVLGILGADRLKRFAVGWVEKHRGERVLHAGKIPGERIRETIASR
jgi:hypothetical protein